MDIAQTQPTTALPKAAESAKAADAAETSGADGAKPSISSDFDTFLTLLTAQIRHQDPMNPMKSEEFAVQLATFSNVEQSVRTNDLLEKMAASSGGSDFTAMSSWIGRDVRAPMAARFSGDPITVDPETPVAGGRHDLVVQDATGAEVDRRRIEGNGAPLEWRGTRSDGRAALPGNYSFSVESFERGELVATEPAATYARVAEVRQSPDGPVLAFVGGVEIPAGSVTAVRESL